MAMLFSLVPRDLRTLAHQRQLEIQRHEQISARLVDEPQHDHVIQVIFQSVAGAPDQVPVTQAPGLSESNESWHGAGDVVAARKIGENPGEGSLRSAAAKPLCRSQRRAPVFFRGVIG